MKILAVVFIVCLLVFLFYVVWDTVPEWEDNDHYHDGDF